MQTALKGPGENPACEVQEGKYMYMYVHMYVHIQYQQSTHTSQGPWLEQWSKVSKTSAWTQTWKELQIDVVRVK